MNIEAYRDYCLSLGTDVEERLPFAAFRHAAGVLAFYVHQHIFTFFDTDNYSIITLKCRPEDIGRLKEQYPFVGKPYNMSAKHWIGIDAHTADEHVLKTLTRNSYDLVRTKYSHA
ncbi:MAG: MmcQ/YjbR family DNA-binding protein [Paludibacteraceae bacterium]|nr:MmcQ/YjbR family DNA-binding protein [Paludibacteraceae bacterium]